LAELPALSISIARKLIPAATGHSCSVNSYRMGDLDDLLSEISAIEKGNYKRSPNDRSSRPPAAGAATAVPPTRPAQNTGGQGVTGTLDSLLDELDCIQPSASSTKHTPQPAAPLRSKRSSNAGQRSKCQMVMLGPPSNARGRYSGVGGTVCCDQLRCTRCDFRVLTFADVEWYRDADYMFFRNRYPDEDRLREKLKTRAGCMAYACQCQWSSCRETRVVDYSSELRWVCAGHS
jgi:hypothetical protein